MVSRCRVKNLIQFQFTSTGEHNLITSFLMWTNLDWMTIETSDSYQISITLKIFVKKEKDLFQYLKLVKSGAAWKDVLIFTTYA